jgi:hypothetical protein
MAWGCWVALSRVEGREAWICSRCRRKGRPQSRRAAHRIVLWPPEAGSVRCCFRESNLDVENVSGFEVSLGQSARCDYEGLLKE